ncbi:hypothetical protein SDC9_170113 [bioreactor metagenome]|uniref:N-acetyltransferase domain-containing protein n=1 Tax=bioreactor metagenome TaxID=1076179 RepID=A0A645G9N6_9ZZZZ
MDFNCRPVETGDLNEICTFPRNAEELYFIYPSASYPLTCEQLNSAIHSRRQSTVVEHNNIVIGFANFYHWEQGCCMIGNFIIKPEYRGSGAASFFLDYMINSAKIHYDAKYVEISCFSPNTRALLLYSKHGFAPFGVERRIDHSGLPVALIHMRKPV